MKKSKKITLFILAGAGSIILAAGLIIVILPLAAALPWIPLMCASCAQPDPPAPQIKYAEFPFTIVYEYNGEVLTYEDKIICEYTGTDWNEGVGKHRTWTERFESGSGPVLCEMENGQYIYYSMRSFDAEYMMGDEEFMGYGHPVTCLLLIIPAENESGYKEKIQLSNDEAYEQYNLRIISFDVPDPIENTFE